MKHLSVLFVGDDAFDTDEGYQGTGQFLFAMLGTQGNHGFEMDSKTNDNTNSLPRSHPAFYSTTIIGGGANGRSGGLLNLKEGTGGKFGNMILTNPKDIGVTFKDCGSETLTQVLPASTAALDYLYFSPSNIIYGASTPLDKQSTCSSLYSTAPTYLNQDPGLASVPADSDYTQLTNTFSPLPLPSSVACLSTIENMPSGYDAVSCKGAFKSPTDNWLEGWSWLDCANKMAPTGLTDMCTSLPAEPFETLQEKIVTIGGDYTSDLTLYKDTSYLLPAQLFMKSSAKLTIENGTSIYAIPPRKKSYDSLYLGDSPAPAVVIEKGATIEADGNAASPITFTTILSEQFLADPNTVVTDTASGTGSISLGERGKWGGLIILGNAPTSASTNQAIEGLSGDKLYGGADPNDNSGFLKYVRVWHGGAVIGANNEINGITFGGVGSGTVVDYCEVAYNADDGFEVRLPTEAGISAAGCDPPDPPLL